MAKNENTASVLAFEKKLVPSDGFLYGTIWEQRYTVATALGLMEKSVRGTISHRLPKPLQEDPLKLNSEIQKPNPQKVDHCALSEQHDTLKLHFTLKVLGNIETPSACNNAGFSAGYAAATKGYIEREGFKELAQRYATNIANARFLWRNRVGAEQVEVIVEELDKKEGTRWQFNAFDFSLKNFDSKDPQLLSLAEKIAQALSGKTPCLLLKVTAYAKVGLAQEVYPSEELVLDKSNSKEKKSKILYHINDVAGMHSQKIGNALRSIDTWYPAFDAVDTGPIAAEPYGAVTNLGKAYRQPKDKADFFTLFDKFARGQALDNKEAEHYVMAVLVRGGVFGESKEA